MIKIYMPKDEYYSGDWASWLRDRNIKVTYLYEGQHRYIELESNDDATAFRLKFNV